jgi:tRNA threonylcarbamoyladenosine biosynthesis protein TsaB
MVVLGLDAALARCSAAVLADGAVLAEASEDGGRGYASLLPVMARDVLARAGRAFDGVAVTVGPGSFTGLRAALAFGHGLALATGRPVVGVTVAEALREAGGETLWVAIDSRRGRVFLDRGDGFAAVAVAALPLPDGPVAVAGDAAAEVVAALAARGAEAVATAFRLPRARDVAAVGTRRLAGVLGPLAAEPLYVDPPEARLPRGGLRPAPEGDGLKPALEGDGLKPALG